MSKTKHKWRPEGYKGGYDPESYAAWYMDEADKKIASLMQEIEHLEQEIKRLKEL